MSKWCKQWMLIHKLFTKLDGPVFSFFPSTEPQNMTPDPNRKRVKKISIWRKIGGNCHQFVSDYSSSVNSNGSKIKHSTEQSLLEVVYPSMNKCLVFKQKTQSRTELLNSVFRTNCLEMTKICSTNNCYHYRMSPICSISCTYIS